MDRNHFNNLLFPCPKEAPHEIWWNIGLAASDETVFEILTFSHGTNVGVIQMQIYSEANFTWL